MEDLITSNSTLKALWERATATDEHSPAILVDSWSSEVAIWARLDNYPIKAYTETKELEVLLGLANLAKALDCKPSQLIQQLLALPVLVPGDSLKAGNNSVPETVLETTPNQTEVLLDHLTRWQATFELALNQAAQQLAPEIFPAQRLEDYLATMCNILRMALTHE